MYNLHGKKRKVTPEWPLIRLMPSRFVKCRFSVVTCSKSNRSTSRVGGWLPPRPSRTIEGEGRQRERDPTTLAVAKTLNIFGRCSV